MRTVLPWHPDFCPHVIGTSGRWQGIVGNLSHYLWTYPFYVEIKIVFPRLFLSFGSQKHWRLSRLLLNEKSAVILGMTWSARDWSPASVCACRDNTQWPGRQSVRVINKQLVGSQGHMLVKNRAVTSQLYRQTDRSPVQLSSCNFFFFKFVHVPLC